MAIRNPRIDSSHSPFKRSAELGPGPKKKSRGLKTDWECHKKAKPKKGTYQQVCKYVGKLKSLKGKTRVITVKKKAKSEYNETYENWLKRRGGKPRFRNVVRKNYRARRALLKGGEVAMSDPVASVIAPDYKKPFMLLVAVVSTVVIILAGLSKVETMVDGRIDIKLAAQKTVSDDHERRLTKIEEKLGSMNDVLAEIRADVKVMRAQMERK